MTPMSTPAAVAYCLSFNTCLHRYMCAFFFFGVYLLL